jgi:hypothetical protein
VARAKVEQLFLVEHIIHRLVGWRAVKSIPAYLAEMAGRNRNPLQPDAKQIPTYGDVQGVVPSKAFADREKAEAHCAALNDAAWGGINPFHFGGSVMAWTSLDEGRLRDWMLDHGLEPPGAKRSKPDAWRRWYDGLHDKLNGVQRRAIREALDRVVFYRVTELTA